MARRPSGWGASLLGYSQAVNVLEDLKVRVDGDTTYIAGPTVGYAVHQELGTSSIEARPFAQPAAERVQANPKTHAQRVAATQGIDISSEEGLVRALAVAVQIEMQEIIIEKDIWDTGALHASVSIERVS